MRAAPSQQTSAMKHSPEQRDFDARRAAARRTAWIMAGVAVAMLAAFVLSVVLR
ncbi:MAG: hypothetical protein L0H70_02920 [Xanthomonadales bacterium]|nr:hypothetical protein [Xanthomonadales bacterium]